LDDPNVSIFIMTLDGQPIGQVRLTLGDNIQLIGYSIDVDYRGHGFGTMILSMVEQHCARTLPLVGKVQLTNVASQRVFEKLGYERTEAPDHFIYTKILST
ncbi:MAG: GNAT family N-acetyltransferase, partial [Selenomonadaceae bacterium]|nr:GNAT family N-acetyltransferase [Selenomonadaceae bacterium]